MAELASNQTLPTVGEWVENPQYDRYRRRNLTSRRLAVFGAVFFAAETVGLEGLFRGWWNPSVAVGESVIGLWFLAVVVMSAGLGTLKRPTITRTPLRVAVDYSGVRAEYDPSREKERARRRPAPVRSVSWSEVRSVRGIQFSIQATDGVVILPISGDETWLGPVAPEFARRVLEAARSRGVEVKE